LEAWLMRLYALNTKLRAMRGELFTKADYEGLCRQGSVAQVADRLRERSGYRALAQGDGEWRRSELEQKILSVIYSDFMRIRLHITDKAVREFLNALFLRNLISLLKKLLCMVFDERDTSHVFSEPDVAFAREYKINLPRLAASKTVRLFINNLSNTMFYQALNTVYQDGTTLFQLEQELDLLYFRHIWDAKDKLDVESRGIMRRLIGMEIDMRNILWVYRLKKHYQVPPGVIVASLIAIEYKLPADDLSRMKDCETADDLLEIVSKGPYRDVFADFDNPHRDFTRALRRAYVREIRLRPFSIAPAAGYLFEKAGEINNVTTVLEGVRYALPPAEIMKYIS
jgi:V/A-type H+-transporting ATPase subunit C